jgi:hypothetical protein
MIIIWDNGQEHADHELTFIDTGKVPGGVVFELLSRIAYDGFLVGTAKKIEWAGSHQPTSVFDCSGIFNLERYAAIEDLSVAARKLMRQMATRAAMRKVDEMFDEHTGG